MGLGHVGPVRVARWLPPLLLQLQAKLGPGPRLQHAVAVGPGRDRDGRAETGLPL